MIRLMSRNMLDEIILFGVLSFMRDVINLFLTRFFQRESGNYGTQLSIRINSRYKKGLTLIDDTFSVERSIMRMMLKGYEGVFMELDEKSFIARSWVG